MRKSRHVAIWFAVFVLVVNLQWTRGENLRDAWSIALGVNQQLQSQQAESNAAGLNLAAAKSARWPTVRNFTFDAFLTATPLVRNSFFGTSATGGSAAGVAGIPGQPGVAAAGVPLAQSAALAGLPSAFPILGPGQRNLPVSLTFANLPLYTGGRLRRNIDAASARWVRSEPRNSEPRSISG